MGNKVILKCLLRGYAIDYPDTCSSVEAQFNPAFSKIYGAQQPKVVCFVTTVTELELTV